MDEKAFCAEKASIICQLGRTAVGRGQLYCYSPSEVLYYCSTA